MSLPIIYKNYKQNYGYNDTYKIGSYEIFLNHQIGAGGYSSVYIARCVDTDLATKLCINNTIKLNGTLINNIVAVKKINTKTLSFKYHKMITEEINIMQHIKVNPHPNIITCYDVIDDLDTIYIVMEYCVVGDFSKVIGKQMKEEYVRYYFNQLVNGIKYLDEHKIIHRDIKPKNLLLTTSSNDNKQILKICDFGLAKNKTGLLREYTICGSPLYMAPEMFKEKSYTDTADIWSVGIIMYEMIYGRNPLSGVKDYNELEAFMINTVAIDIPPKNDITEECLNLLKRLLTKDSDDRITLKELYTHKWLNESHKELSLVDELENKSALLEINKESANERKNDSSKDSFSKSSGTGSSGESSNIFLFNLEQ